jgi:hypothetical protein
MLRRGVFLVLLQTSISWPAYGWPAESATGRGQPGHWAFLPIADPSLPAVNSSSWPRTTIDRFILVRLEAAGLAPSPPADRRTLIRRAYYDLAGLPPTWDEVSEFVGDPLPTTEAFETIIDELLASPRYGERWGRHWLDVARFADTKDGVLMYGDDRVRPYAYTYRDYVIRAINEDVPFDRFIHEQLAADQIEPAVEPWRLAAMGFLTLGRMYDNNVHDIIDDQIDTVTRGFLGLTVSCARCHDHKYDPIPTADYYSLYGVFASSEAPLELPLIGPPQDESGAQEFEKEAASKREELRKTLDAQYELLTNTARERIADYLIHVATTEPDPAEKTIYFLSLAPEDLRPPIVARWRALLARRATSDDPVFGPWHDLFSLFEARGEGAGVAGAVLQLTDQWAKRPADTEAGQRNPLVLDALKAATCTSREAVARTYGDLLRRVYDQSCASSTAPDAAKLQLLNLVVGQDSPLWFPKSQTRTYMSRSEKDAFAHKLQELDKLAVQSPHAPPRAMVLMDAEVLHEPRVFVRGNPVLRGDPVPRQFLKVLSRDERAPFAHGSGRLDLAHAITSPDNPLTARVIVNRVWMHHFGEPLVATPSDFGTRGTPPTHPELLDHLATWFIKEGWSLKKLHRQIMRSAVYQQASGMRNAECGMRSEESVSGDSELRTPHSDLGNIPHSAFRTPHSENRLLWRMNRRRLDFEAMRDALLAVSGRLDERSGGRPVDIAGDPECRYRSVYGLVDRQSLPCVFRTFDFASPDQSIACRPRTTVPQQALFALNSPFAVRQAKALAARPEVSASDEPAARITSMYRIVLTREPSREEVDDCLAFVEEQKDSESELSKWEQLAQVLLSSNELMYVD